MPNTRYVLFLSVLPWLLSFILVFTVHPIFLIFIPIVGLINTVIAKKQKPIRKCKSCHAIQRHLKVI
ncbi:hypothetical protein JCM9140_3376 [Halalkalibacter wakoensis JCM 9140]|uniref:Uncharacterized protein n=1 Tax=Halalkalibacter wakoensis JCM 9140 TaxID=1236970 RepID=W4Q6B1_9BACI|nr:hypothetical protein [Halalkalibacter wakoensis]GAE27248.1 hypothetical protein JCM9140_3376 [Halalkalibacter wakoensis JCM 9140]